MPHSQTESGLCLLSAHSALSRIQGEFILIALKRLKMRFQKIEKWEELKLRQDDVKVYFSGSQGEKQLVNLLAKTINNPAFVSCCFLTTPLIDLNYRKLRSRSWETSQLQSRFCSTKRSKTLLRLGTNTGIRYVHCFRDQGCVEQRKGRSFSENFRTLCFRLVRKLTLVAVPTKVRMGVDVWENFLKKQVMKSLKNALMELVEVGVILTSNWQLRLLFEWLTWNHLSCSRRQKTSLENMAGRCGNCSDWQRSLQTQRNSNHPLLRKRSAVVSLYSD